MSLPVEGGRENEKCKPHPQPQLGPDRQSLVVLPLGHLVGGHRYSSAMGLPGMPDGAGRDEGLKTHHPMEVPAYGTLSPPPPQPRNANHILGMGVVATIIIVRIKVIVTVTVEVIVIVVVIVTQILLGIVTIIHTMMIL